MFELHYEPLYQESGDSCQISLLPWDIETFGFGVADIILGDFDINSQVVSKLGHSLDTWTKNHDVELVGTSVNASDISKVCFFQSLGFRYVDMALKVHHENIQDINYPSEEVSLIEAQTDDIDQVLEICGKAFRNGRYHADACLPGDLANKRYQDWARRTFDPKNPQILFVTKKENEICGFSIIEIKAQQAYLHLNAVAPKWQGKHIGTELIISSLCYLQQRSVTMAISTISAANIPAMNLHANLGATFHDPKIIMHWHAPWTKHLKTTYK